MQFPKMETRTRVLVVGSHLPREQLWHIPNLSSLCPHPLPRHKPTREGRELTAVMVDELWQAGESHPGGDVVPPSIQGADPVVFDDVPMSRVGVPHRKGIGIWRRSRRSCEDKLHPSQGPAASSFHQQLQTSPGWCLTRASRPEFTAFLSPSQGDRIKVHQS